MGNKKGKEMPLGLTPEDTADLAKLTGFSEEKIRLYHSSFLADCPTGKLSKKQFQQMYRQLYPHMRSDKFCNRIFTIFDHNKDNKLDFYEFLRALKITMNGDLSDKLKCAFEIYDLNGDGKIDKKEMKKVLNHIYDMLGEDTLKYRRHGKMADKKVDLIFSKFDVDGDDCLSLEEFIQGCLKDEYLNQLLKSTLNMTTAPAGAQSNDLDSMTFSTSSSFVSTTTTTSSQVSEEIEQENEHQVPFHRSNSKMKKTTTPTTTPQPLKAPPRSQRRIQLDNSPLPSHFGENGLTHLRNLSKIRNIKEFNTYKRTHFIKKNAFGGSNSTGSPLSSTYVSSTNLSNHQQRNQEDTTSISGDVITVNTSHRHRNFNQQYHNEQQQGHHHLHQVNFNNYSEPYLIATS